ncbi:MAG: DUF423 domain-containing protein [Bryobacteraceae bacterium]|nr:DUF423 domain-containing protein [Bryobacteraceae bacterium]
MNWTATAAILLALAVMLGAFGAHSLRGRLDAYAMGGVYEKAVFYHFIHALGMLIVANLPRIGIAPAGGWVCSLLLAGILIFSGSLYALAITGARSLGAITPIGGLSFIAAWLLLAVVLLRGNPGA